jgi:hypothetical protein
LLLVTFPIYLFLSAQPGRYPRYWVGRPFFRAGGEGVEDVSVLVGFAPLSNQGAGLPVWRSMPAEKDHATIKKLLGKIDACVRSFSF